MNRCLKSLIPLLLGAFVLGACLVSGAAANGDRLDVFSEGFESGWLPDGWSTIHLGSSFQWARTSQFKRTGNYSAWCRGGSSGTQDEWLVTPALDFSTLAAPQLEWYELSADWATADLHAIMASTTVPNNPAAFVPLFEMTPANHTPPGFQGDPVTVDLASLAGEPVVYLAFRYVREDSDGDHWFIDDIRIFELLERDIMTVAVSPDGENFVQDDVVEPTVTFYNNGSYTESFTATLEIYETGNLIYTEVLPVNDLPSDTTIDVDFPTFVVNTGQVYDMQATASMDGDLNPNNDTKSGYATTWTIDHVPMCILFTNSGCVPCVPANQTLDAYMPGQGNSVALTRVHVWWPWAGDIMYQANTAQATELVNMYGVSGVPNFFVDGFIDLGSTSGIYVSNIEDRKRLKGPIQIDLAWDPDARELTVDLNAVEPLLPTQLGENVNLRVVMAEDNIQHQGPNGEPVHMQAFRRMYPSTAGLDVQLLQDDQSFVVECPLGAWVYENLKAIAYLQEGNTGEIIQAATAFLTEIETTTPAPENVARRYRLDANYPNPFNPSTTIAFSLPGERLVDLAIYALDGTRVATLVHETRAAGEHNVTWQGVDDRGQPVASGTYLYRIKAGDYSESRTMTLVK